MNGMNKINYNVDCEGRIEDYTVENTSDAKIRKYKTKGRYLLQDLETDGEIVLKYV